MGCNTMTKVRSTILGRRSDYILTVGLNSDVVASSQSYEHKDTRLAR